MNKKAFTLIEIMIVVAIIAILVGMAIPNYRRTQQSGTTARAKSELRALQAAVENYYIHHNNVYPAALTDLTTAVPKVINAIPNDVFRTPAAAYSYARGGTGNAYYIIYSVGPSLNGSAAIGGGDTVTETNPASCIFVSNIREDTTP